MYTSADSEISAAVREAIAGNRVMIFSKSYCPHCKRTKKLFKDLKIKPAVLELDQHKDGPAMQEELRVLTGQRTVPNVFINGVHLGGADDTHRAHQNGELAKLLAQEL